jgi:hypothetical protein
MKKVEKLSTMQIEAQFKEIFDGATIEEATQKAHESKKPSDNAEVNITDSRVEKVNIKLIGEENDESKK